MVVGAPLQPRSGQLGKAIALNKKITACRSADDILSIYQSQGRDFNYVNLATAINSPDLWAAAPTTRAYERSSTRPR